MNKLITWYLKKGGRAGIAHTMSLAGGAVIKKGSKDPPSVRILTYHGFLGTKRDPFSVSPLKFEKQMAFLAERGLTADLNDLEMFIAGQRKFSKDRILVTIDDGLKSLYRNAAPILRHYAIPAIAFVTTSEIGIGDKPKRAFQLANQEPRLTPQELLSLANSGITIGSHSWTHRSMAQLDKEEALNEAMRSRQALEEFLGQAVTTYAYPFGTRADFNNTTRQILESSGYRFAFTSQHGAAQAGMDSLELPRVKVEGGEGMRMFRLIVDGCLDAWRLIDQTLWRLQSGGARGAMSSETFETGFIATKR